MAQVTKIKHFNMVYSAVWRLVMPLTIFTMLVVYALQGHSLNAHKVYAVITIFQSMVSEINWLFGGGLEYFSQLRTGCKRVQTFLMLEEIGENRQNVHDSNYSRSDSVTTHPIVVDRATIQWQMSQHKFALDEISLRVKRGELLTVIGTVGSGKSTFLASLLNEPSIVSGSVSIAGKVAYASQEPWCFNDTIEANILFGQSLDPNRLNQVIEACALRVDLESMPHREKTLVGERGMILSGGQKARVALARALYSDADIYLLDDPLSAVDAEVAKHIFEQCIEGYLRDKTVVLVTHQVQFIKNSSKILVLDKGQPLAYGTYEHVLQSDSKLLDFIRHVSSSETKESKSTLKNNSNLNNSPEKNNDSGPKIVPENMQSGAVGFETYRRYFKSGASWPLMAGAVGGILVGQVVYHWSDLWLVQWTNAVDLKVHTDVIFNAVVYFLLLISDFLCHILKSLSLHAMCIKASTSLHDRVFEALMRARIAFFDKNPAGRILDRFTKDLRVADVAFENTFDASIRTFLKIVGSVTLISYFRWQLIAPAVMVLALAYYLRTFYAQPSRDLKRMESSLRSPVLNHAHLTLGGLSIIRAFQAECLVTEQFYRFQNDFSNGSFIRWSFSNLFSMIVNWFCHFYVLCTAIALMVFYGDIKSGTAGLILTMAFGLIGPIQYSVRRSVQLESEMTSVERLEEYTKLEPEGPLETNYRLPENWPSSGRIEFDHVSLSYDGENDVLKDLTFEVRGGEKVSIVGRTGAGKSSVLAALFRMVEVRGRVAIDGVPSNALGLNQLRSALAIIPQEPMAFVGSVRTNLDPLSCHSDGELWQALRSVQLESTVEQWEGQLDYELSEGGTNLSVGQRQLVCLARALLRGNQILVLDEATANVDHHTDQLIQGTIRKCFAHCTVITIAHRLHTIIDSNRVLVLDAGRLVQFDTPRNLLAAKTGIFYNLVQQTGPEMAAKLENAVFNADHKNGLFN